MSSNSEAKRLAEITRGSQPLEGLCKERLITPEACDWLKFAVDPFHDMQLDNLRGYPDVSTEPTVVVKVRQALTVAKPPGIGDGDTWNCHIVLSPVDFAPPPVSTDPGFIANPSGVYQGTAAPHALDATGALGAGGCVTPRGVVDTGRMDGLLINSVPDVAGSGSLTYTPGHCPLTAGPTSQYQMQQLNLDDYLDFNATDLGVYRIVYSGFEVVNTTAQISKQGAVTVYEYGNSYEMASANCVNLASATPVPDKGTSRACTYFRTPPNTLAEAKIMPGSHSWAAQDGCYNTAKFQCDNPFQGITGRNFAFCQNQLTGDADSGFNVPGSSRPDAPFGSFLSKGLAMEVNPPPASEPYITGIMSPTHFSRMNTTGAYFTGLSSATTLFVTWRVGFERLPAANKPTFLALAQPSATYDPNALVLYNIVSNALPPGCPQGYNDAGKWFRWISENVKKAIPTVYPIVRSASMLAGAMGRPVIGGALSGLASQMKPVAEKMASSKLQAAVRARQARNGGNGKRAAVQNWQKPGPRGGRSGGTNGLG